MTARQSAEAVQPVAVSRAASAVVGGKLYLFANGLALAYDPANEIR